MKFIDLFAGIGGFRLGLENIRPIESRFSQRPESDNSTKNKLVKWECVYSNEWDKYASQVYKKHYEQCDTRDIKTIPTEEIPDHDLLCAGFPCQSFSIAGKRGGFEDTRGTLFFEICRIAEAKKPSLLLLENVKGLLSHQQGWTFATILLSLDELGYDAEWQVCNSKNYGVPQNRERVFIVGHLREESRQQIFPIGKADRTNTRNTKREIANCLDANYHKGWLDHGQRTMVIHDKRQAGELRLQKEPCVTKHYGTGGGNVPLVIGNIYPSKGQAGQVFDSKGISKAIVPAKRGGSAVMPIIANAVDCDGYLRFGQRPRDENGKPQLLPIGYRRIRRLTPVECERLQGFPDNWTEGVSDTQRYKMLGNAVTVNVIQAIEIKLTELLRGEK